MAFLSQIFLRGIQTHVCLIQNTFVRTFRASALLVHEKSLYPYIIQNFYYSYHGKNALLSCSPLAPFAIQKYAYAKGKSKGSKKQSQAHISDDDLGQLINIEEFREDLEEAFEKLKSDYIRHLSVRTQAGSLESIPVHLEGSSYPLGELAQIVRKSATSIIINASAFPQATANIKKALLESGMNLNPQQEGTTFYVPIPKVTKEHREGLAQNAKTLFEKTKIDMREIQNNFLKKMKLQEGKAPADLIFNGRLRLQEMTREWCSKAEAMMKNKQSELLQYTK